MINYGYKRELKYQDFNSVLREQKGYLDNTDAQITLAKFLRHNLGFTFRLMSGINLFPWQEIILKGLFIKDNGLVVAARGAGKSTLISVFCCLYPVFNPNTKICLISSNFRGARRIFEAAEKMTKGRDADLLYECFYNPPKKMPDIIDWKLENGSNIFALPLSNGEGLRGTRANVVLVDEGLLISKEIQEVIIKPFLTVRQDVGEENEIKKAEDGLIERGIICENDRISFPRNKYHVFSSASYQFEYLYEMFKNYVENTITPPKEKNFPTYFVARIAYDAIPEWQLFDISQINSAKANGGENSEYFKKEYRALFPASSNSYFNIKKMHDCTVKNGEFPTTQIKGDKNAEYILSIDPAYGSSKTNDFFAMGLYLINKDERKITLVHTYGRAGDELKSQHEYLTYLLKYFNVVFITIDASGDEFIKGYNESVIAKENNIKLGFFTDSNFDDDSIYLEEILKAKNKHNILSRNYVYGQKFNSLSIRKMNEHLQNRIEAGKVWFASPVCSNEEAFKRYKDMSLPIDLKSRKDVEYALLDFIEEQDSWINETKAQLALIEVRATSSGVLQYDLPGVVRNSKEENRPRKDNYTCLLLACYAAKVYFDMCFNQGRKENDAFIPQFLA